MNIQGKGKTANEPEQKRQPIEPLSESEIWELARHVRFARLGTVDDGVVHITPINVVVREQKIYFRTAPGAKLTQLILDESVTVQFDSIGGGEAYSINMFGRARLLTDSDEIAHAETLGIRPWINTVKLEYVEITPEKVVGRKFLLGS